MLDKRLYHHLVAWLGQWPPRQTTAVVGSERRTLPGWDGKIHPFLGVGSPSTGTVLSAAVPRVAALRAIADLPVPDLLAKVPDAVGAPDRQAFLGVFRWTTEPAPLPDAGEWTPVTDPVVPEWLRVFAPEVLIHRDPDSGAYLAGVGIKRHDRHGNEISVGTEPAARGKGLARRLVAQAARRILDEGAVPTYLHDVTNLASSRVAESAGFADRGWSFYGLED
ncbi:GNAT family N-acetyltransferase [Catenuloplanes atrovinosus]|uniref:GNAT superfamily N-acetyltransferase n=1 Tax=Catenuloplanes atrovinosus TaxID=137266 RepID=A0AAE3YWE8_9ACTN|nr:GNAT family N-acetyltransferase [Catenuloplanes atrovinosus]MDR7281138.1 GNAT superfamily N-acetyltransferase [Catenuloplanes atrovinosus]